MVHKEKPLFHAITSLEGGTVVTIVCTGDRRDKELANIAWITEAWAMYKLLMVHKVPDA